MREQKYTPGEWQSEEMHDGWNIRPVNGGVADKRSRIKLCMAFVPKVKFSGAACSIEQCGGSEEEQEANAHLIAAVSDLLLALEMIYESCPLNQELKNIARAALAKAMGV